MYSAVCHRARIVFAGSSVSLFPGICLCLRLTKTSGRSGMFFFWGSRNSLCDDLALIWNTRANLACSIGPARPSSPSGPQTTANANGSPAIALGETDAEVAGSSSLYCQRLPVARKPGEEGVSRTGFGSFQATIVH